MRMAPCSAPVASASSGAGDEDEGDREDEPETEMRSLLARWNSRRRNDLSSGGAKADASSVSLCSDVRRYTTPVVVAIGFRGADSACWVVCIQVAVVCVWIAG